MRDEIYVAAIWTEFHEHIHSRESIFPRMAMGLGWFSLYKFVYLLIKCGYTAICKVNKEYPYKPPFVKSAKNTPIESHF